MHKWLCPYRIFSWTILFFLSEFAVSRDTSVVFVAANNRLVSGFIIVVLPGIKSQKGIFLILWTDDGHTKVLDT